MFFMKDWEFFMSGRDSENMGQRMGTSQAEGLATSGWWQRKGEPEQNPVDSRIAARICRTAFLRGGSQAENELQKAGSGSIGSVEKNQSVP